MRRRRNLLAVLLIAAGLATGGILAALVPAPAATTDIEWLGKPRPLAPVTLQTAAGPLTPADLRGRWHILLLGYTQCPDVCPASLANLARLAEALGDRAPRVVFLTVDPDRDSPGTLGAYARHFHPGFVGARAGRPRDLQSLARSLRLRFAGGDGVVFAHSVILSLVGPDGRLRARLRPGFDPDRLAEELRAAGVGA